MYLLNAHCGICRKIVGKKYCFSHILNFYDFSEDYDLYCIFKQHCKRKQPHCYFLYVRGIQGKFSNLSNLLLE